MLEPSYDLQVATVGALKGFVPLTDVIDKRVYDSVPANVAFPYVSFGPVQILPDGWDCQNSSEIFLQIDAWSRKPGFTEVKKVAGLVRSALHDKDLPLTDSALVSIEFDNMRVFRDPDGLTSHAAITFRAVVEHD